MVVGRGTPARDDGTVGGWGGADPGEEEPLLIAAVPNEGAVG